MSRSLGPGGPGGSVATAPPQVDSFLDAKLHTPPTREDWVERVRLLDLLDRAVARPMVLVSAPAGYGKTTLVAQWLQTRRPPHLAAWVSLDAGDNDPVRFWTHVATALERTNCRLGHDAQAFVAANSNQITTIVLPGLINALAATSDDIVILLDDYHFVHQRACHEQIEFLVEHLPPRAHLVLTTRSDPALRLGRVRASGQLGEIRSADLAFNAEEATTLLAHEQVEISTASVLQLVQRTEGWPTGLYLATLSLSGRTDPDEFVRQFNGDDRFIGDYMTEEVLRRHPEQVRDFITTVSILDRFSASLCDFVAETSKSATLLRDLERTNMFLVPLDEQRDWYRFHHLFARAARNELEISTPDRVASLHGRAAEWFREHGHVDDAIEHLLASGNNGVAALLVQANWLKYVNAGRGATVMAWLDALGPPSIASDPAAGVTAAWMAALSGDEAGLAGLLRDLEGFRTYGPLPDGTRSVESAVALIQGIFGYGGPVEMAAGAQRAVELETDTGSPYYAFAILTRGHSAYVAGELDLAIRLLDKATHAEAAQPIIRVMSASTQSLAEAECGHPQHALELAEFAMEIVDSHGLGGIPQASMAYTALAPAQAAVGNLAEAMATAERGTVLRQRNPALGPWATIHHLLAAARVALAAGEVRMARDHLEEAERRMDRYPDGMGVMRARLVAVAALKPQSPANADSEQLTERETDVLRLLRGSMSLAEIAGQLYVSHNTVKSHTRSLYRKLGVSSRDEAVSIAQTRFLV